MLYLSGFNFMVMISALFQIADAMPWSSGRPYYDWPSNPRDSDTPVTTAYNCLCIDIRQCPSVMDLFSNRPLTPETLSFIKISTCGFNGFNPYVCCAPTDADRDTRTRRTPGMDGRHGGFHGGRHEFDPDNPWSWGESDDCNSGYDGNNGQHGYGHHGYGFDYNHPGNNERRHHWDHFTPRTRGKGAKPSTEKPPLTKTPTVETVPSEAPPPIPTSPMAEPVTMSTPAMAVPVPPTDRPKEEHDIDIRAAKKALVNSKICGVSINNRIIGGEDAVLGAYPWVARIGYTSGSSHKVLYRCGATLINNDYVITAAHCVSNLPSGLKVVAVRLGELDERSRKDCSMAPCADAPQDFTIGSIVVHPMYGSPRYANDIALVRLNRPANITAHVSPICLPIDELAVGSENLTGTAATVTGWGSTSPDSTTSSQSLQWAALTIGDSKECALVYAQRFNISVGPGQLCTQGRANVDACQGDSGGPLFRESSQERFLLTGIVSFGPRRCGTASLPGVYTRVSQYTDWILDNIQP